MSILKKIAFTCERRLFILAFLAFFLLLFIATNANAISKIAFMSERDGNEEIYVMNADGSGQTNLTNNPAWNWFPAWSPDGSKIAFMSDRDCNGEIYVMNADGSGQTNLTNNPAWDDYPAWSPDGSKIAFMRYRDGNEEIYVMNADGTGQTRLTNNPGDDYYPAWSPDGSKIAFHSYRDGNYEIYVMNADGTGQTNLTNNPVGDTYPDWSPDGSKIAFTSARDGNVEIYVMNADGSGVTRLTNNPADDFAPAWSPDGSKIAFASARDGNEEIYVMNADGSGQTNLTNNPAWDWFPDWSPSRIKLPRTGQTKCYDTAGAEITCAGTGQDGEIQAGVAWPDPRFTDNLDGSITDNLTGLMWTQDGGTPTVGACSGGTMTWQNALNYVACLNSNNYLGHNDWRLPNINELRSLVHSGYNEETCGGALCVHMSDWLNSKGFSNVPSYWYWSSTTSAYYTDSAWTVFMGTGTIAIDNTTDYVWPVRGGQSAGTVQVPATGQTASYTPGDDGDLEKGAAWPSPRFTDNGDGTVTDNLTGLVWLKNANCTDTVGGVARGSGYLTWTNALTWSNSLASGACGLTDGSAAGDWRVPNWEELESLIDFSRNNPALPAGHPFSNMQSYRYWSSTTYAVHTCCAWLTYYAWVVDMWDGAAYNYNRTVDSIYVWPVRGGTITSIDTDGPSLSITSHTDGLHVTTSSITLAGTATDSGHGDNGIQQVTVNGSRADNDTATGSGTANWSKVVNLNAGANPITVIAYDDSTNHNQTSQTSAL